MSDSGKKGSGQLGDNGAAVIQVTPGQIVGAAVFLFVAAAVIFLAGMFARGLTMSSADDTEPAPAQQEPPELENVAEIPAPDPTPPDPAPPEPTPEPLEPEPSQEEWPEEQAVDLEPKFELEVEPEPKLVEEPPTVTVKEPLIIEPEPEMEPVPTPAVEETEQPAPPTEPEPPAEEPPPPPPAPEPEPEPAPQPKPEPLPEIPASTTGPYTVQVMYIGIEKRAEAEVFQRNALENKNVRMELVETPDAKGLRAYVGSYANRADAEKARNELLRAGFTGCFITKR